MTLFLAISQIFIELTKVIILGVFYNSYILNSPKRTVVRALLPCMC